MRAPRPHEKYIKRRISVDIYNDGCEIAADREIGAFDTNLEGNNAPELTDGEKIDAAAKEIMNEYREAFLELAK